MKKMKTNVLLVIILILSSGLGAQELTSETRSSVNVEQLPEYIVVTSENTKLLGGIDISIDYKKFMISLRKDSVRFHKWFEKDGVINTTTY